VQTASPGASGADRRLALASVVASAGLALLKLRVAGTSGSLALYGSALDAGLDIAVTAVTYVVVRAAETRASDHPDAGQFRLESFGALLQTLVLVGVGGFVVHAAVRQLTGGGMTMQMQKAPLAIATLIVSAAVDLWRSTALARAARRSGSPALAAAALNFRLDFLTTSVALVGLLSVGTGFRAADPVAAVGIGLVMVVSSVRLLRQTLDGLSDRAPDGVAERVSAAALAIPGASRLGPLRIRRVGPRTYVDLTVLVDAELRLREARHIEDAVQAAVSAAVDGVHCTVLARAS
jgi:cation diffusion facilitator family transporter